MIALDASKKDRRRYGTSCRTDKRQWRCAPSSTLPSLFGLRPPLSAHLTVLYSPPGSNRRRRIVGTRIPFSGPQGPGPRWHAAWSVTAASGQGNSLVRPRCRSSRFDWVRAGEV